MTVEGISTPQPPDGSGYQAARVGITLVCLIGVPALALVGWGEPAAARPARRHSHAKSTLATTTSATSTTSAGANSATTATPAEALGAISQIGSSGERVVAAIPGRGHGPANAASLIHPAQYTQTTATPGDHRAETGEFAAPAESSQDRMQELFARLQKLGATYYKLETAATANHYWFQCRVAGTDIPFEAGGRVPLVAIEQVVGEVEAFRSQRTGSAAHTSLRSQR